MNITPHAGVRKYSHLSVFACILLLTGNLILWQSTTTTSTATELVTKNRQKIAATLVGNADSLPQANRITGAKSCQKCHQDEFVQWQKTMHSKTLEDYLVNENDKTAKRNDYAKALGIPITDIAKNDLCTSCHATQQKNAAGELIAISGVSCESCHGASGGEKEGWLKLHGCYDYFTDGKCETQRDRETPEHRKKRLATMESRGKVSPNNLFALAKICYGCHIVDNEKLVAVAGHPAETQKQFEFASWTSGEIRHNFHWNRSQNKAAKPGAVDNAEVSSLWLHPVGENAESDRSAKNRKRMMYVIGLLAELETRLRIRAETQNLTFISKFAGKIPAMQPKLLMINTPQTQQVAAQIPLMLGRLFVVQADDKDYFNKQADTVAQAALQFQQQHNGSALTNLDGLIPKPHYSKQYKK